MKITRISDPRVLIETINGYPNHYIYRGQANSDWILQSTLGRVLQAKYVPHQVRLFEKNAIEQFQNKFHLYDTNNDKPNTKLAWLAIMQHYGVPTRLLDFSTSPYVALYFAIEETKKSEKNSCAIYAIDYRAIQKSTLSSLGKDIKEEEVFEKIIDEDLQETLWVTEPAIANRRLDRQAGSFLISSITTKSYEEILGVDSYKDVFVEKTIIPLGLWDEIYTLLVRVNITGATIYGDLEGLSKSIKMMLQAYS